MTWTPPTAVHGAPAPTQKHPPRVRLVQPGAAVRSSDYRPDGSERLPLRERGTSGWFVPEAARTLTLLAEDAARQGWDLQITSGYRSAASQALLWEGYNAWRAAGRPARNGPGWVDGMHDLAVGRPGFGTHQSGRAVDVRLAKWFSSGATMTDLWELMRDYGWRPFFTLREPDPDASEAWHFDYIGEWRRAFSRHGYRNGMICATADVCLLAVPYVQRPRGYSVQAQLIRAGADIVLDGHVGPKTIAAAAELGVEIDDGKVRWRELYSLETA